MAEEALTEKFLNQLLDADNLEQALGTGDFTDRTFCEYAHFLLDEKGLVRADIVRKARLNSTYGWQVFEGQRNPGRNTVLRIALAMGLTLREVNRLLAASNNAQLYCKNRRDAIIIFCIDHGRTLEETDDALYEFGEETISSNEQ